MAIRYEDVTESVMEMFRKVKSQHFQELKNAKIRVLFDLKKRKSGGRIVVGRILKANDLVKHLTKNANAEEGYDFIITLDKKCWDHVT
ncbi:MAG: putative metallopeptidase, partial [Syntrophorhabdus sp.]